MKKYIFMFIFVITIISFTLYNFMTGNVIELIEELVKDLNYSYVACLFGIIIIYFILQALYMKIILKSLNCHISLIKGIFYSMVEFYFSGITPSSTGGQPMQVYFMAKDKIPMSKTYITLILNTIFFKVIIVSLGLWVLIFYSSYVLGHSFLYTVFFFLGLLTDILMITLCMLLLFHESLIKKVVEVTVKIASKIPFFKKSAAKIDIFETVKKYKNQISYMKNHKKEVILTFIITLIQRLLILSVAYVVYRGLGMNNFSYLDLLAIQISVQVTIEMFPIPGGAVISENMLTDIFVTLFGVGIAEVGMIFTRLFNYYIPLLFTGVIIIIYYIRLKIKEQN